ncbi:MAG: hypothetical protein AAF645_08090, partial [Myxococcota bacterium]
MQLQGSIGDVTSLRNALEHGAVEYDESAGAAARDEDEYVIDSVDGNALHGFFPLEGVQDIDAHRSRTCYTRGDEIGCWGGRGLDGWRVSRLQENLPPLVSLVLQRRQEGVCGIDETGRPHCHPSLPLPGLHSDAPAVQQILDDGHCLALEDGTVACQQPAGACAASLRLGPPDHGSVYCRVRTRVRFTQLSDGFGEDSTHVCGPTRRGGAACIEADGVTVTPLEGLEDVAALMRPWADQHMAQVARVMACILVRTGELKCALAPPTLDPRRPFRTILPRSAAELARFQTVARNVSTASLFGHLGCAVARGTVRCWGTNWSGLRGPSVPIDEGPARLQSTVVEGLPAIRKVAVSSWGATALTENGRLYRWGHSPREARSVRGVQNAAEVAVGDAFTCIRTRAGAVRCWGRSGGPDEIWEVPGLRDVVQLRAHRSGVCARQRSGRVACWKRESGRRAPRPFPAIRNVIDLEIMTEANNEERVCLLRRGGTVLCSRPSDHPFTRPGETTFEPMLRANGRRLTGVRALSGGSDGIFAATRRGLFYWGAESWRTPESWGPSRPPNRFARAVAIDDS